MKSVQYSVAPLPESRRAAGSSRAEAGTLRAVEEDPSLGMGSICMGLFGSVDTTASLSTDSIPSASSGPGAPLLAAFDTIVETTAVVMAASSAKLPRS